MSQTAAIVLGGLTGACILIVVIVLIACSFSKVEMTEVGLLYSHASRKIDRKQLYTAGRYYVGVGGEFITFPITQQEMHLPIFESRTEDGLLVSLDVSLNYKFDKDFEKILKIFDNFGHHYDGFIARLAMNIIRDASARFTAYSYSMNRSLVNLEMERDISDDMSELGFSLDSVQLLNIEFPKNFSNTLQNTRMLQQQVQQATMNLEAEKVSLDGELKKSNVTAAGYITEAKSHATSIRQNAEAESEALKSSLSYEAESHKSMIDFFLSLEDPNDSDKEKKARKKFVNWYWLNQISTSSAPKNVADTVPDFDKL